MAVKKKVSSSSKSNTWTIIIILIIIALIGLALWAYFSQNAGPQFSPKDNCGANQVLCAGKCQSGGLACSECLAINPQKPFKNAATGDCTSAPTNIGN